MCSRAGSVGLLTHLKLLSLDRKQGGRLCNKDESTIKIHMQAQTVNPKRLLQSIDEEARPG